MPTQQRLPKMLDERWNKDAQSSMKEHNAHLTKAPENA